jgi:uncharacterized SAM-binding protein YcdF (DUF218 family)
MIIALGAPNDDDGTLSPVAEGRALSAGAVHRSIPGAMILPTGGFGEHFNRSALPHHELIRRRLIAVGVAPAVILPGVNSTNTSEDAEMSSEVVREIRPSEVEIVTSDFHHERASMLFARFLPSSTIRFVLASSSGLSKDLRLALFAHEVLAIRRLSDQA